jgi:uncharacterized membrane protein YphA (DoxX/SURF4 family)
MLVLRVVVGAVYLVQAYLALFVATPTGTGAWIGRLGLPAPTVLALAVILAHGLGGAMLVIGLWTRAAAATNAAVLLVGLLAVYLRTGTMLRGALVDAAAGRATAAGYEYVALLAAATVALALESGGGRSGGTRRP